MEYRKKLTNFAAVVMLVNTCFSLSGCMLDPITLMQRAMYTEPTPEEIWGSYPCDTLKYYYKAYQDDLLKKPNDSASAKEIAGIEQVGRRKGCTNLTNSPSPKAQL